MCLIREMAVSCGEDKKKSHPQITQIVLKHLCNLWMTEPTV